MKTEPNKETKISIPETDNYDLKERNMDRANMKNLDHCPYCGLSITNPKFFINSIYGGDMYPANEVIENADAWVMGVGSECRKKFPKGYVFETKIDKYPTPEKDGLETIYKDGTILRGSWASRLDQWRKLLEETKIIH